MNKIFYIKILLICFFILRGGQASAQTTVQVVTKTVDKAFEYTKDLTLNIDGERAEISVLADPNAHEVKVKLELMSKHPLTETAKKDIENLKYAAESSGKNIYLRNYIAIKKSDNKPQSDLKARYTVILPKNINLSIKNNFGKLTVTGINGKMFISTEFCKVILSNLKGILTLNARFGDIEGYNLQGTIASETNRCDLQLSLAGGSCDIKAVYGKIKVDTDIDVARLSIKTEKAEVLFFPSPVQYIYCDLEAQYGKIILPKSLTVNKLEKNKSFEKVAFRYNPKNADKTRIASEIIIKTHLANLEIGVKP